MTQKILFCYPVLFVLRVLEGDLSDVFLGYAGVVNPGNETPVFLDIGNVLPRSC